MKRTLLMTLLMLVGFGMARAEVVEVGYQATGKLTNYFPVNSGFNYSLSQQIYTASEIGKAGSIVSISFYRSWDDVSVDELSMNGLKLYMKHTTKSKFSGENDMIPVGDADLVWEGTFEAPERDYRGWVTISLDKPFNYNGSDNLMVCLYDTNPASSSSRNKFYYVPTSETMGLSYYSTTEVPDLNDLSSFSGNKMT